MGRECVGGQKSGEEQSMIGRCLRLVSFGAIYWHAQVSFEHIFEFAEVRTDFRFSLLSCSLGELPELDKTNSKIIPSTACACTVSDYHFARNSFTERSYKLSESATESFAPGQVVRVRRRIDDDSW